MEFVFSHAGWAGVSIEKFSRLTRDLPLDLYLRVSVGTFCHVFSRNTGLDYERLYHYRQKGVTHLYVRREDFAEMEWLLQSRDLDAILSDPTLKPERRAAVMLQWTERILAELFGGLPISDEVARESRRLIRGYIDLMKRQPHSLAAMLQLLCRGSYLHYHSVAVSVFTGILARGSTRYGDEDVELLAWAGLLHEIGSDCTEDHEDEWGESSDHAQRGEQLLRACSAIPSEVAEWVGQHHFRAAGGPASLLSVVDQWSSLISSRPGRAAHSPKAAYAILGSRATAGEVDGDALGLLRSVLRLDSSAAIAS